MFDFDVSKLLLVALLALIVLGPEKLPKAARMAGVVLRRVRVGWDSVRSEVEQELQLEELRTTVARTRTDLRSLGDAAARELRAVRVAAGANAAASPGMDATAHDGGASPDSARPGCTPEDIDGIAERSRVEMENIRRIAARQVGTPEPRPTPGPVPAGVRGES